MIKTKNIIVCLFVFVILSACVFADFDDKYFFIKDNGGPYKAVPGSYVNVDFVLVNQGHVAPRNVSVSFEDCPSTWTCESAVYSYPVSGDNHEILSVYIPDSTPRKKYTLYLSLESEYWTKNGDNRILFDVISEKNANTISYEEYLKKQSEIEKKRQEISAAKKAALKEKSTLDKPQDIVVKDPEPVTTVDSLVEDYINLSEVSENVERLESDRFFVEYLSVVLIVVLLFIVLGAYTAHKNSKTNKIIKNKK